MYQDGRSKESEKMITETETYKELQAKFNAERRSLKNNLHPMKKKKRHSKASHGEMA